MAARCNCDDCTPDPAFTCSYTGKDESIALVYIANAYRGNLILCPGGANGPIGGLLHQLDPPQHYSHMGIMVADYDLVRHTTAVPSRLSAEEYYTGNILGVSAPVDGLNVDHVQYGWPGSITQSAEQIFFADTYGEGLTPPGLSGPYHGSNLVDMESPSRKSYGIAAISFQSVSDDGKTWFPALVVKPCTLLETAEVNQALNRVADEALKLFAHYRFYCYTQGFIGDIPAFSGPATAMSDAMPKRDPSTLKWMDWSDPSKVNWTKQPTIPAVCSSFVWQAVQATDKSGQPKIVLDWAKSQADALGETSGQCKRAISPDWSGDTATFGTIDGMYKYDAASRATAAKWLNDSLSDEIYESLKGSLKSQGGLMKLIANAIDDIGRGAFIAAASAGTAALLAALSPVIIAVLGPAAGAIVMAAIDVKVAEQLIELLFDMPDDIANQVCNSFAFDCHRGFPSDTHCVDALGNTIGDVDSTNWSSAPGDGLAVSPDNIHMFWDAPGHSIPRERLNGIYGYNTPVKLVVGVVTRPRCELVPSTGTAVIHGMVLFRDEVIAGAYVRVNCQHTISGGKRFGYSLTVRSGGHYKVIARYEDPKTGKVLYGERSTNNPGDPPIAPGAIISPLDITLLEPPTCMRNVVIGGWIRVDDVYFTGADHGDTFFTRTLYVQSGVAKFDETTAKWIVDPNDPVGLARRNDVATAGCSKGDSSAGLKMEVTANPDLSIDVTFTGTLNPGDDNLSQTASAHVLAGATVPVPEFDLDTGGPFNDRAYFRNLVITNLAAQAI